MKGKNILCPRCYGKTRTLSKGTDHSTGGYVMRVCCRKCRAVFSMSGKSHSDIMRQLRPVQAKIADALLQKEKGEKDEKETG